MSVRGFDSGLDRGAGTAATPVSPGERIKALDILRGFALLGMILVHFHTHMEREAGGLEGLIGWFTWVGVETKAWGTFALLFGVGFAVLMRSLEARRLPIVRTYLRRLLGLAAFGFVAEAFFGFSVLLEYAIWGVPLLFVRRWSSKALLALAVCAVAIGPLATAVRASWPTAAGPISEASSRDPAAAETALSVEEARQTASYADLVRIRLRTMGRKYGSGRTWVPDVNLALFIVGFLAFRRGIVEDPRRHKRLIGGWMAFGFAAWATWWLVHAFVSPSEDVWSMTARFGFGLVRDQWLCFAYAGSLVLLLAFRPAWTARLSLVGAAGRMALTNYMLQVAALDWLSSGYGASLHVRPAVSVFCSLLLFGVLAGFSHAWLGRFRFGPAEWIWRNFTYLRWQPMGRNRTPLPRSGAAAAPMP